MLSVPRRGQGDEEGAIALVTALVVTFVLFVVAALTVDIGNAWATRGALQNQADKAALFAGQYLPASLTSTQLVAARAAVEYMACHPVPQETGLPACSDNGNFDSTSTSYTTSAQAMITSGAISFPSRFEISVKTPSTRVQFSFAGAVGLHSATVSKTATTHVYSPGSVEPVGGSLSCLAGQAESLSAVGAGALLNSVLPIDYWSAGGGTGTTSSGSASVGEPSWGSTDPTVKPTSTGTPSTFTFPNSSSVPGPVPAGSRTTAGPNNGKLTLTGATLSSDQSTVNVSFTITQADIPASTATDKTAIALVQPTNPGNIYGWFRKTTADGTKYDVLSAQASVSLLGGSATITVPSFVTNNPGDWYMKIITTFPTYQPGTPVKTTPIVGSPYYTTTYTTSYDYRQSNVTNPTRTDSKNAVITDGAVPLNFSQSSLGSLTNLDNLLPCQKSVLSPRLGSTDELNDLVQNIRNGLDHTVVQNPNVASLASGVTSSSNLGTLVNTIGSDPTSALTGCPTTAGSGNINDTLANRALYPNCLHVKTGDYSKQFTSGFLTPNGRLSCTVSTCQAGRSVTLTAYGLSGSYNADNISDFIKPSANSTQVLNDLFLTTLDTYLTPSVPVLTQTSSQVDASIYSSPRFFWTPVLTTAYATNTDAYYPILTFRPAFLTSTTTESPLATAGTIVDPLCTSAITQLGALLNNGITSILGLGTSLQALVNGLSGNCSVSSLLSTLTGNTDTDVDGLLLSSASSDVSNGSVLKAVRVINLNPGALPPVPDNYSGPVNDYVGSGPKIVRLVR